MTRNLFTNINNTNSKQEAINDQSMTFIVENDIVYCWDHCFSHWLTIEQTNEEDRIKQHQIGWFPVYSVKFDSFSNEFNLDKHPTTYIDWIW